GRLGKGMKCICLQAKTSRPHCLLRLIGARCESQTIKTSFAGSRISMGMPANKCRMPCFRGLSATNPVAKTARPRKHAAHFTRWFLGKEPGWGGCHAFAAHNYLGDKASLG